MPTNSSFIIFTDLDGTLLDHDTYTFEAATPAIQLLSALEIPIIFNTSKTLEESCQLSTELGIHHPLIVENGGAIMVPANYTFFASDSDHPSKLESVIPLGAEVSIILETLLACCTALDCADQLETFSTMGISRVTELTGLSPQAAALAKNRRFSQPFLWHGSQTTLNELSTQLHAYDLQITRGGRFHHVTGLSNKRTAMEHLVKMYKDSADNGIEMVVIALGDSENDISMLEGADIAVAVRNDARPTIDIEHPKLIHTTATGPEGWREAIELIMRRP